MKELLINQIIFKSTEMGKTLTKKQVNTILNNLANNEELNQELNNTLWPIYNKYIIKENILYIM